MKKSDFYNRSEPNKLIKSIKYRKHTNKMKSLISTSFLQISNNSDSNHREGAKP